MWRQIADWLGAFCVSEGNLYELCAKMSSFRLLYIPYCVLKTSDDHKAVVRIAFPFKLQKALSFKCKNVHTGSACFRNVHD